MNKSTWKAMQTERDILKLVAKAMHRPETSTPQPPKQVDRNKTEKQALAYLKSIRTEIGAAWDKDTLPSQIKTDLDAWVAAGSTTTQIMQRINKLLPFWASWFVIQNFEAPDQVEQSQPDVVTHGQSVAETNGWTDFRNADDRQKYKLMGDA